MNGPQDIGGKQGLGTVPYEPDEPVFHSEWERRVFGLSFCSWLSSGVTVDESRWMQATMPYERYYGSLYYERWLYSLERLMVEKGVATQEELERGASLADPALPVVEPSELAAVVVGLAKNGIKRERPAPAPGFEVGQTVRAKVINPSGYDRLPTYLRGRRGAVDCSYGGFVHPEDLAAGRLEEPGANCYRVRFSASELWGESAENPEDSVCIDLFENYLEQP